MLEINFKLFWRFFRHLFNFLMTAKVWVDFGCWNDCGRGLISQFWLRFESHSSFGNPFFTISRLCFTLFSEIVFLNRSVEQFVLDLATNFTIFVLSWIFCGRTFHLGFRVVAAISLNFDCYSILTSVMENYVSSFFDFSPTCSIKTKKLK